MNVTNERSESVARFDEFPSQVFDEVHDSIVTTDLDGVVTNWNKGAARIFGYEPQEAIGKHISFVYPEDQRAFLLDSVIAPLKARGTHEVQVRMRRRSGEDFLAHLVLSMMRDSSGEAIGMIGYSKDVTEEERAKEALEARLRQSSAVARLGFQALLGGEFEDLLHEAVSLVAENLRVEYAKVLELLPDGNFLLKAGVGWREGAVGRAIVNGGGDSQAGYTVKSNAPVIVEDLQEEKRFSGPALLRDHGVVSGISVIILGRDGPYGVLGAHTTRNRRFTSAGVDFLQSVANVLAAAAQRQEAARTLLESEQRFRQLADHVDETFWMTDFASGELLYVSPRFDRMWGRPRSLLTEKPGAWLKWIVPEDRGRVAAHYVPELLTQGAYDVEYRISRPDGTIRWIQDRGFPVKNDQGQVVRIAGVARDVTHRRESQDALRRQSELLDVAHDAIVVRDLATQRISYWNGAAERLYGWTREEAVGRLPKEILATQYPQPLGEIERALAHAGHWSGEIIQRTRDGETLVVHAEWILQRDQRGQPLAIMQLNERVDTEGPRTAAELERLVALVDTSPVALLTCDVSGKVLFADQEAWEFFGLQPERGVRLETFEEVVVMRHAEGDAYRREDWPLRRALRSGENVRAEEVTFEFGDGRHVTALVNATPFYNSDGQITAAVASIQDLSPIEQLEKMRNEFLGVVAHELKTPLTVIKGAAAFGAKGVESGDAEQTHELFEMIGEQSARLETLIRDLSDSAHIESGAFSVERELTNVCGILEEARRSFTQSGLAANVRLDCSPELPQVLADRKRIAQVIHNLLSNAAKYSPAGSPVSVSANVEGLHVVVRVMDRGPGIPAEQRPLLFRRYSRLETNAPKIPGSGLGLYICKGIVEAHGGRIGLETSGEEGSVFRFTLPLLGDAAVPEAVSRGPQGEAILETEVPPRRVLVVDDDVQILRLLRRSLQESGYEAIVTSDPAGIVETIQSQQPSLAILDVRLPRTSGFEVLSRIRESSAIPVIILTASDREEDIVRALELGADDYITKPFSPSELVGRVETCMRARARPM